jgi:hypothetical protein
MTVTRVAVRIVIRRFWRTVVVRMCLAGPAKEQVRAGDVHTQRRPVPEERERRENGQEH